MAVKASATVTLSSVVDVKSVWRYYKLQASTLSKPSKPTTNPPSGWTTTEPSYTNGSTNSLYLCDLTVFCDNSFSYSDVSLSSSYEAAKAAYNKAVAADDKAQDAKDTVDNMKIGGRNMLRGSSFKGLSQVDNTYMKYKNNSVKLTVDNTNGTSTKYASIGTLKQSWDLSDVLGKTLTISMWIYIEEVDQLAGYEFRIVYSADGTKYWDNVDKTYPYYKPKAGVLKVGWNYVYACYTIPINATEAYFSFTCYAGAGKTSTAWFSSPKAEIGNKPTEWTPAPEDMATADDVSNLVTRVTAAETSITNNQNEIKLKATKTEVTEAVNNIQVGGRNLLVNTNTDNLDCRPNAGNGTLEHSSAISRSLGTRYDKFTIAKKSTSWCYVAINDPDAIKKVIREGGEFTLSFDVFCDAAVTISNICIQNCNGLNIVLNFGYFDTVAAEWTKIVLTGTVKSGVAFDAQVLYINLMPLAEESLIEFSNIKLEKGNKATDWTPAPEDMLSAAEAAETYTTQTEFTQNSEEIRMDFNTSISSASNNLQSQMAANNTDTDAKFAEINKYIRFVDGKIILGETGNELMLTIQNDSVSFTQSGVEVAYFSNNNLYVKRAEVLTTMKIGNYEFAPRNDGGLALRKRSE